MTLLESIRKKRIATATLATVATHADQSKKIASTVATVATVAVATHESEKPKDTSVSFVDAVQHVNEKKLNVSDAESIETEKNILLIQEWLASIGEPIEDWDLVLNKCRNDAEAMRYFLSHSRGEFL